MIVTNEMELAIDNCLQEYGVSMDQKGYYYLKDVIVLTLESPEKDLKDLVHVVGEKYNVNGNSVYTAIKYTVKKLCTQEQYFSPKKLILTCVNQVLSFARQNPSAI